MNENQPAKPRKKRLIVLIVVAALVVLAVAAYFIARTVAHSFIQSEISTRSDWEIDTGDVADREAAQQVTVYTDPVEATIEITQIVPDEYEDEGFTYYDEEVQDRLASTLLGLTQEGNYTMGSPLAILNPFGTGSNGLYLYFGTSNPGAVHRLGGGRRHPRLHRLGKQRRGGRLQPGAGVFAHRPGARHGEHRHPHRL